MVKRLNLWFTAEHASVTVVNGAERQTSGSNMPTVLEAMPPADLETLRRFCLAVLHYVETRERDRFTRDLDTEARPIRCRHLETEAERASQDRTEAEHAIERGLVDGGLMPR